MENRWVKLAQMIVWCKVEVNYRERFKSWTQGTEGVLSPCGACCTLRPGTLGPDRLRNDLPDRGEYEFVILHWTAKLSRRTIVSSLSKDALSQSTWSRGEPPSQ